MILDAIIMIIEMIIGGTNVMIQIERKNDKMIIAIMIAIIKIKIIHHLAIMVIDNNIEGGIIKKTANLIIIDHQIGSLIMQRELDNFSMILREETLTPTS